MNIKFEAKEKKNQTLQTMIGGKFPKRPNGNKVIELCGRQFDFFKQFIGLEISQVINALTKVLSLSNLELAVNEDQTESLEDVRRLLMDGEEEFARSTFLRAFPTCLPYRNPEMPIGRSILGARDRFLQEKMSGMLDKIRDSK